MVLDLQGVLIQWQQSGVFHVILPALLLFAVIFGILSSTNVFGANKAVHLIVALVIAMIAVASPDVQIFFQKIFENTGIALAVIVAVVLLTAIFIPDAHKGGWAIGFYSLGGIAALFVVFNSFSEFSFFGSQWWYEWGAFIIGALLLIGVIIAVSVSGKESKPGKDAKFSTWRKEE